jgi:signal transduction histidine kinase
MVQVRLLIFTLILLISPLLDGAAAQVNPVNFTYYSLPEGFQFTKPSDTLKLPPSIAYQGNWKDFNLGMDQHHILIRLNYPDKLVPPNLVDIEVNSLDTVRFFTFEGERLLDYGISGDRIPFSQRKYPYTNPVFTLEDPSAVHDIWIQIKTAGVMQVPLELMEDQVFLKARRKADLINFFFISLMISAAIYSFIFFLKVREFPSLFFSIYAVSTAFVMLTEYGYAFQFFWPEYPALNHYQGVIYSTVGNVLFFAYYFLKGKEHFNLGFKLGYLLSFIGFLTVALLNLVNLYEASILLVTLMLPLSYIFIASSAFYVLFIKKFRPALSFLIGWSMIFVAILMVSFRSFGYIPVNTWTDSIPLLGFTIEILILFFAIAQSFYAIKQENENLIKNQTKILERKVTERTRELEVIQIEIANQNIQLLSQQEELAQQANILEQQNFNIDQKNKELELHKVHLEELVAERTQAISVAVEEVSNRNQQLEQFAYVTSHNLRGPIATQLGLLNLLQLMPESQRDSDVKDMIERLSQTTQRLDGILKDLAMILEVSDKQDIKLEPLSLKKAIDEAKGMVEQELMNSESLLDVKVPENQSVMAFHPYLVSVFYNLFSNSIKYREPGRKLKILVSLKELADKSVLISVTDNGSGMDMPKVREKIFGLYKRFNTKIEGRGVGLYLVKTQVIRMGGNIEVESESGVGTTFMISLTTS